MNQFVHRMQTNQFSSRDRRMQKVVVAIPSMQLTDEFQKKEFN